LRDSANARLRSTALREEKECAIIKIDSSIQGTVGRHFCASMTMNGLHLLGEWFECPSGTPEICHAESLRSLCLDAVAQSGLQIVGDCFHQFLPQGVTGAVLLAESHLAIHTWPEHGSATIDVYVCNVTTDNCTKARELFRSLERALQPGRTRFHWIERGTDEAATGTARSSVPAQSDVPGFCDR
jgi:S-adenosylmethionine decarboxylase